MLIAKSQIGCSEPREIPAGLENGRTLELTRFALGLDPASNIDILGVPFVPVGDQEIFIPIEIDIQENGSPTPFGCRHVTEIRNLRVSAIAPIQEERVHFVLRPVFNGSDW